MYTKEVSLGKFEGNPSQWEAKTVYNASMDGTCETVGSLPDYGYYACIVKGRKMAWIVFEDEQGFVDVTSFNTHKEASEAFNIFRRNT